MVCCFTVLVCQFQSTKQRTHVLNPLSLRVHLLVVNHVVRCTRDAEHAKKVHVFGNRAFVLVPPEGGRVSLAYGGHRRLRRVVLSIDVQVHADCEQELLLDHEHDFRFLVTFVEFVLELGKEGHHGFLDLGEPIDRDPLDVFRRLLPLLVRLVREDLYCI